MPFVIGTREYPQIGVIMHTGDPKKEHIPLFAAAIQRSVIALS